MNIHYLLTYYGDDFVMAVAQVLGIDPSATGPHLGKAFKCILPGHKDEHPSASLYRADNGVVVYHDWHTDSFYLLPEVFASQAYRRPVKLISPELATWHLRLLVETGFVQLAAVCLPPLPAGHSLALLRVYDGFRLLLGCKWLYSPGEPTPFSWRFASAWCGMSERHVGPEIQKMLHLGIIRAAAEYRSTRGTKMLLFLPGGCDAVPGQGDYRSVECEK